jgi:hypothetical protein
LTPVNVQLAHGSTVGGLSRKQLRRSHVHQCRSTSQVIPHIQRGRPHPVAHAREDGDFEGAVAEIKSMIRVKVKTKKGIKPIIAHGLINRRAEESAPFRK